MRTIGIHDRILTDPRIKSLAELCDPYGTGGNELVYETVGRLVHLWHQANDDGPNSMEVSDWALERAGLEREHMVEAGLIVGTKLDKSLWRPSPKRRSRPPVDPRVEAMVEHHRQALVYWKPSEPHPEPTAAQLAAYQAMLDKDGRTVREFQRMIFWLYREYVPDASFDWRPICTTAIKVRKHWLKLSEAMRVAKMTSTSFDACPSCGSTDRELISSPGGHCWECRECSKRWREAT